MFSHSHSRTRISTGGRNRCRSQWSYKVRRETGQQQQRAGRNGDGIDVMVPGTNLLAGRTTLATRPIRTTPRRRIHTSRVGGVGVICAAADDTVHILVNSCTGKMGHATAESVRRSLAGWLFASLITLITLTTLITLITLTTPHTNTQTQNRWSLVRKSTATSSWCPTRFVASRGGWLWGRLACLGCRWSG